jgi:hypothetical protein
VWSTLGAGYNGAVRNLYPEMRDATMKATPTFYHSMLRDAPTNNDTKGKGELKKKGNADDDRINKCDDASTARKHDVQNDAQHVGVLGFLIDRLGGHVRATKPPDDNQPIASPEELQVYMDDGAKKQDAKVFETRHWFATHFQNRFNAEDQVFIENVLATIESWSNFSSDQQDEKEILNAFFQQTRANRWGDHIDCLALTAMTHRPIIVFGLDSSASREMVKPVSLVGRNEPGIPMLMLITNPESSTKAHYSVLIPLLQPYTAELHRMLRSFVGNHYVTRTVQCDTGVCSDPMNLALFLIEGDGHCFFSAADFFRQAAHATDTPALPLQSQTEGQQDAGETGGPNQEDGISDSNWSPDEKIMSSSEGQQDAGAPGGGNQEEGSPDSNVQNDDDVKDVVDVEDDADVGDFDPKKEFDEFIWDLGDAGIPVEFEVMPSAGCDNVWNYVPDKKLAHKIAMPLVYAADKAVVADLELADFVEVLSTWIFIIDSTTLKCIDVFKPTRSSCSSEQPAALLFKTQDASEPAMYTLAVPLVPAYAKQYQAALRLVHHHPYLETLETTCGPMPVAVFRIAKDAENLSMSLELLRFCWDPDYQPEGYKCPPYISRYVFIPPCLEEAIAGANKSIKTAQQKVEIVKTAHQNVDEENVGTIAMKHIVRHLFDVGTDSPDSVFAAPQSGTGVSLFLRAAISSTARFIGLEDDPIFHRMAVSTHGNLLRDNNWAGNVATRNLNFGDPEVGSLEGITNVSMDEGTMPIPAPGQLAPINEEHYALVRKIMDTDTMVEFTSTILSCRDTMDRYMTHTTNDGTAQPNRSRWYAVKIMNTRGVQGSRRAVLMWIKRKEERDQRTRAQRSFSRGLGPTLVQSLIIAADRNQQTPDGAGRFMEYIPFDGMNWEDCTVVRDATDRWNDSTTSKVYVLVACNFECKLTGRVITPGMPFCVSLPQLSNGVQDLPWTGYYLGISPDTDRSGESDCLALVSDHGDEIILVDPVLAQTSNEQNAHETKPFKFFEQNASNLPVSRVSAFSGQRRSARIAKKKADEQKKVEPASDADEDKGQSANDSASASHVEGPSANDSASASHVEGPSANDSAKLNGTEGINRR